MTRPTVELQVPESVALEGLKALFSGQYGVGEEVERQVERTYLESFDWRVFNSGGVIESVTDGGGSTALVWRKRKTDEVLHRLRVTKAPGLVEDLPEGAFRRRLAPILEMRRLLPLVTVQSHLQTLRVLGAEEKTVVRLEFERARFLTTDGEYGGELGARVHLVPVRGYDADFDRVRKLLTTHLAPVDVTLFDNALLAIGRVPNDYSSKLNYRLNPAERADRTAKEILLGLLRTLETNVDGARANVDSEFLHDLRVATRRTRSALTQIKSVFPTEVTERFKEGFAWVGQVTGPTRDMDVYLLALDGYKAGLPAMLRDDLEPLREFLTAHHAEEQKGLARKLTSPHFRKLLKEWRTFLEAPVPNVPLPANAVRPAKEVADERIWRMYRRVMKEGRAIHDGSPPEELHELRKSCKKLRYLMEFFDSLYPGNHVRTLVKVLKVLLDNLGDFQDLEVQAHALRRFAESMVDENRAAPGTLLAMGALIGGLAEHQREARARFAETFAGFDTRENNLLFKALFKPVTGAGS